MGREVVSEQTAGSGWRRGVFFFRDYTLVPKPFFYLTCYAAPSEQTKVCRLLSRLKIIQSLQNSLHLIAAARNI